MAAGGEGVEPSRPVLAQDALRKDRARAVAGAEEQHIVAAVAHCLSTVFGAQQAAAFASEATPGFFARTKALMNLPSTAGATASTSMSLLVRNSRASSM